MGSGVTVSVARTWVDKNNFMAPAAAASAQQPTPGAVVGGPQLYRGHHDTDEADDSSSDSNEDSSCSGPANVVPPSKRLRYSEVPLAFNPLVSTCPCGCNDDHSSSNASSTPGSSPLKTTEDEDAPLDMSKTGALFKPSPPQSPPTDDREKFRCLYLLVDAAVSQLESDIREGKRPPPKEDNKNSSSLSCVA